MPELCTAATGVRPNTLRLEREPDGIQPPPRRWRAKAKGRAGRQLLLAVTAVLISLAFTAAAHATTPQGNAFLLQFGSPGSGNGQFASYGPIGIAVDPSTGDVYVSEFGTAGSGPGQFNGPIGVAVDPSNGDVYVTDYYNDRVEKFDSSGNYLSQFGTSGTGPGQFGGPNCVVVDPHTGNVYVTDRVLNRVEEFDSSGNYLSQFGTYGTGNG